MGELLMRPGRNCCLDSRFENRRVFVIHRATEQYIAFLDLQLHLRINE